MRRDEQPLPALRGAPRRRRSAARLIAAQVGYQLRIAARSPLGAFATLVVPLMVLLAVNLLYRGTHLSARGGIAYVQFFTPAMVAFAVINVCYMSLVSHTTLVRDEGILKRVRGTPLPPWVYMAGSLGSAGVISLVSAIAVLALGAGVYGFQMVWSAVPVALLTVAVGMFCFSALGLAVTVIVPSADSAFAIAWGTMLPLCFISNVFMPIDGAPRWLGAIASAFPVRPFADSLEHMFNPVVGSIAVPWAHLAVMGAWGVGATAFALLLFKWEPAARSPRRAGGAGHGRTAFAVERLREVLEERVGRHEGQQEATDRQADRAAAASAGPEDGSGARGPEAGVPSERAPEARGPSEREEAAGGLEVRRRSEHGPDDVGPSRTVGSSAGEPEHGRVERGRA